MPKGPVLDWRNAPLAASFTDGPTTAGAELLHSFHDIEDGTMQLNSLKDLYIEQLRDLYSAEDQLTKALPEMAKAASHDELRKGFEQHHCAGRFVGRQPFAYPMLEAGAELRLLVLEPAHAKGHRAGEPVRIGQADDGGFPHLWV